MNALTPFGDGVFDMVPAFFRPLQFSRAITLPEDVDDGASEARYADGVLYLKLQKKRATQVKRLAVH